MSSERTVATRSLEHLQRSPWSGISYFETLDRDLAKAVVAEEGRLEQPGYRRGEAFGGLGHYRVYQTDDRGRTHIYYYCPRTDTLKVDGSPFPADKERGRGADNITWLYDQVESRGQNLNLRVGEGYPEVEVVVEQTKRTPEQKVEQIARGGFYLITTKETIHVIRAANTEDYLFSSEKNLRIAYVEPEINPMFKGGKWCQVSTDKRLGSAYVPDRSSGVASVVEIVYDASSGIPGRGMHIYRSGRHSCG